MRTQACLVVVLLAWHVAAHAQPKTGDVRAFVACPVYRDTDAGRKSGCWLADEGLAGVRYDVSLGLIKPQVGRTVLVEGVVADPAVESSALCGGQVLSPVTVSVLPERCPQTIIPAEQYPGRAYKSPPEQLKPFDEPRALPPPPYAARTFTIFFELGRDFLVYQYAELILEKAWLYAKASDAKSVRVEGFAAVGGVLVDGRWLREPASLADARADMVAEALRRLGVSASTLQIVGSTAPSPSPELADGKLPEASKRRVTITITP